MHACWEASKRVGSVRKEKQLKKQATIDNQQEQVKKFLPTKQKTSSSSKADDTEEQVQEKPVQSIFKK